MKMSDIIKDESGWCKGTYKNDVGAHCLSGAVLLTGHKSVAWTIKLNQLAHIIRTLHPERVEENECSKCTVVNFNDDPNVTYAQIEEVVMYYDSHYSNANDRGNERVS